MTTHNLELSDVLMQLGQILFKKQTHELVPNNEKNYLGIPTQNYVSFI